MQAFAGFLVFVSFLVLVIGLIKPAWVLPRVKQPSRLKAIGSAAVIFAVAIIVGVSSGPEPKQSAEQAAAPPPAVLPSPAPAVLPDVSKANVRAIQSVERTDIFSGQGTTAVAHPNGNLTVIFKVADNLTLHLMMVGAAQNIFDAAEFQVKHGKPFYLMTFIGEVNVEDRYGRQSVARGFEIRFQQTDLKQVVWDNMDSFKLLNLTSSVSILGVAGRQVVEAFCKEEAGQDGVFCSRAGMW